MADILVVDDDPDLCEVMREVFMLLGAHSCLVASGLDDIQKMSSIPRDLAVLDVNLGANNPTGLDVYRWLIDHGYEGRVVFFTGHGQSDPAVQAALALPNVELLSKPVPLEQLARLVS